MTVNREHLLALIRKRDEAAKALQMQTKNLYANRSEENYLDHYLSERRWELVTAALLASANEFIKQEEGMDI